MVEGLENSYDEYLTRFWAKLVGFCKNTSKRGGKSVILVMKSKGVLYGSYVAPHGLKQGTARRTWNSRPRL